MIHQNWGVRVFLFALAIVAMAASPAAAREGPPAIAKIEWDMECRFITVWVECDRGERFYLIKDSCDERKDGLDRVFYRGRCSGVRNKYEMRNSEIPAGTEIFIKSVQKGCNTAGYTVPTCQ